MQILHWLADMAEVQVSDERVLLEIKRLIARVMPRLARAPRWAGQIAEPLVVFFGAVIHAVAHVVWMNTDAGIMTTSIISRTRLLRNMQISPLVSVERKGAIVLAVAHEKAGNA